WRRETDSEGREPLPLRSPGRFRDRRGGHPISAGRPREGGSVRFMAEKKGRRKAATAAVPSAPGARDIGIDVPSPAKVWTDRKCPFYGGLPCAARCSKASSSRPACRI